jgi:hypothetical protein
MALEYALGMEKPVLFIDVPRRIRNPDWQELGIEPIESAIRSKIGTIISPEHIQQVDEKIYGLLARKEDGRMVALKSGNYGHVPIGTLEEGEKSVDVSGLYDPSLYRAPPPPHDRTYVGPGPSLVPPMQRIPPPAPLSQPPIR